MYDRPGINDVKAIIVGVSAAFMMYLVLAPIIVFDIAPFNLPPPSAFLASIGLNVHPLPWLMHFFYGVLWSVIFMRYFGDKGNIWKGLGLSMVLWLMMMAIYSPIMGWGFFGFGNAHLLDPLHPLYLREGWAYAEITLVLHVIYGSIIGWLNPLWRKVGTL